MGSRAARRVEVVPDQHVFGEPIRVSHWRFWTPSAPLIRLQDNLGTQYQLFANTAERIAWAESSYAALASSAEFMSQLRGAVGGLPVLDRNVDLLEGDEYTGFLVFNMNITNSQDHFNLMNQVQRLRPRIAEVPVELN